MNGNSLLGRLRQQSQVEKEQEKAQKDPFAGLLEKNGQGNRILPPSLQPSKVGIKPVAANKKQKLNSKQSKSNIVATKSDSRVLPLSFKQHISSEGGHKNDKMQKSNKRKHEELDNQGDGIDVQNHVGKRDSVHCKNVSKQRVLPQSLLANRTVQPSTSDEESAYKAVLEALSLTDEEVVYPPGGILKVSILKHQAMAVGWMIKRESGQVEPRGGILADDQGLGKTVTTISLIMTNTTDKKPANKPTFVPEPGLNVQSCEYFGGTLVVCPSSLLFQWEAEIYDKVSARAVPQVLVYHGKNKVATGKALSVYDIIITTYQTLVMEIPLSLKQSNGSTQGGPLFQINWHRVILDEAQYIKNSNTQASLAVWGLQADKRWCLTGTPIQNSVDDLFAYFRFLRYSPYNQIQGFRQGIKDPITSKQEKGFQKLHFVLKGILIRRTKSTTFNGQPIICLPKRIEQPPLELEFSEEERKFYSRLEKSCKAAIAAGGEQSYMNVLTLLMQLRQACNHPLLLKNSVKHKTIVKTQITAVRKLKAEVRQSLLDKIQETQEVCQICGDIPEDAMVSLCAHVFCKQCFTTQSGFSNKLNDSDTGCLCPSCNTFVSVNTLYSLNALLQANGQEEQEEKEESGMLDQITSCKVKYLIHLLATITPKKGESRKQPMEQNVKDKQMNNVLNQLKNRRNKGVDIVEESVSNKVIVFSQWTSMLDFVGQALEQSGYKFRRLDGSMSLTQRESAINEFSRKGDVVVLLLSLKAAAVGLNLTCANNVVLLDPWWNPTVEDQAIDRAHRIGQAKDVQIFRFTVKNTVEQNILKLQQKKKAIVQSVLGGSAQTAGKLSMEDIKSLF